MDWTIIQSRKDSRTLVKGLRVNAWTPCHHRLERWTLGGELLLHRMSLLHSPDFIPPAFGARRMVITVHDLSFVHFSQCLAPQALRHYAGQIEWAISRADHILADSNQTREDLIQLLSAPPDKVTTVHLAADERFRPLSTPADQMSALRRYGLSPGYVLFVGTLEPRKNIPTLLAAYRRLLDRNGTRVPLVLVGRRGWSVDDIFETVETLQLGRQVRVIDDGVGQESLVELYNGAGVLVLPSFYEGFGLPVLEAMACGTPVVAAHRGSLPEIVGDAGLLINPEDADGLASAIERVLADEGLRSDLIERGYAHASKFTWAETARQTLRVYRRVLPEAD
jgi:glycosyltransferase involved in cell wall biosynthesis